MTTREHIDAAPIVTQADLLRHVVTRLSAGDLDPHAYDTWRRYYQGHETMWLSERVVPGGPPLAMTNFGGGKGREPVTVPWNSNERRLALIGQCMADDVEFEPLLELLADDLSCARPIDALLLPGFLAYIIALETGETVVWLSEEAVADGPPRVMANLDRGPDEEPFSISWDCEERREALREVCVEQNMAPDLMRDVLAEDSACARPEPAILLPGFQSWLSAE